MTSRLHISTFLALAIGAWAALLWFRGTAITWDHFWPYSLVLTFLGGVVALFEHWLWRLSLLQGWFVKRPDLRGTWQVELRSEWVTPETGGRPEPIICYMAVRQTLSTLSMRLFTPESASWLIAHKITLSNDGVYQVAGVYMNKPQLHLRGKRSEIHYGAILLDIQGYPTILLEGHYWTDRNTKGTMTLTQRNKEVFSTYQEAHNAFTKK